MKQGTCYDAVENRWHAASARNPCKISVTKRHPGFLITEILPRLFVTGSDPGFLATKCGPVLLVT